MSQLVNRYRRYLVVPFMFLKTSAMAQIEYRFEFFTWTLVSIFWIGLTLVTVDLIFGHISALADWTKNEVLLVVAVNGIFTSLIWMFIQPSLENFMDNVRTGTLDFYLTKPISSRFFVSVSKYDIDNITRVLFLIYYILFVIGLWHSHLAPISIISFFVVFVMGLVIFYNVLFIMSTTVFWFIDLSNLSDLMDNVLGFGKYPTYIFEGSLRFILFFVVPVAFVATFPVQFLIGKGNNWIIVIGLILLATTSAFSQWFWNFALKRYSSASS